MLEGYDIVCIAPGFWDESLLDVHRYMPLLAKSNRVLVIERAITPISFLTPGQKNFAWKQMQRTVSGTLRHITDNLIIATPPLKLPLRYEDPFLYINQFFLRRWLQSTLQSLDMKQPVFWCYEPDIVPVIEKLEKSFTLYMVTDDYASNPLSLNRESQIRKWERRMLEQVDLVISSGEELVADRLKYNPNTRYVAHGVNHELFATALDPALTIPPGVKNITEPIIGFVGRINQRIDLSIIEAILEKEWTLLMVGQIGDDEVARKIASMPGILFAGHQAEDALAAYLKAMSVCIIPYSLNEHTRHIHPLKALEYLAAGKAVVSTPLASLKTYQKLIDFASTPADFLASIENAIHNDSQEIRQERSRYTASMTWLARLEEICVYIEPHLQRSPIA